MTIDKIKKFTKEHKTRIIAGTVVIAGVAALSAIVAKSKIPAVIAKFKQDNAEMALFLDEASEASKDCTHYIRADITDIWSIFDNEGNVADAYKCPDGALLDVKNIMLFGTKVEVET